MMNVKTGAALLAGAILAATASPNQAQLDVPFYDYFYYSDSTYQEVVGTEYGTCFNGQAAVQPLVGQATSFALQFRAGVCRGDLTIYE